MVITCLCCNTVKRFLSRKDYVLWKGIDDSKTTQASITPTDRSAVNTNQRQDLQLNAAQGKVKGKNTVDKLDNKVETVAETERDMVPK